MPIDLLEQKNISLVEEPPRDLLSAKEPPVSKDGFDEWYSGWAKATGISPDPDDPRHHYDYRAAYKAGASPKVDPRDKLYHWPSQFKAPDHPNRFVNGIDTLTGEPVPEPNPSMLREIAATGETALHLGSGIITAPLAALTNLGKLGYDLIRGKEPSKAYKEAPEWTEAVSNKVFAPPFLPETKRNLEFVGQFLGLPQSLAEWTDKQIGEVLPAYKNFVETVPKSGWGTFLSGVAREAKSFGSAVLALGGGMGTAKGVKGKLVERAGRESPETLKAIREQVAKDKLLVEERAPIDLLSEEGRFQPAEGKPPFQKGIPGTEPTEYTPVDRGRGVPLRPPQELTPEGIVSTRAELGDYAETPEIPAPIEPPYRGGIPGTEPTEYTPLDRGRGVPLRPAEELTPEGVVDRRAELGDYGEPVETTGPVYPPFRGEMKPSVVETLERPTVEPVMGTPTPKPSEPFIPETITPPGPRPTDTFKSREDARLRSLMGEPVKKSPAPTTAPLSEPIAGVEGKALPGQGQPSTPVEVPPPTSPAPLSFANPPERSGTYPAVKSGDTAFIGEGHIGALEAAGQKGIGVESLEDGFVQYPSGRWLTRDQMTDLIKNNRGETTIPMELANYVIEGAKKAGKSVDEFLKNRKGALATLRLTKEDMAAIMEIARANTRPEDQKRLSTIQPETVESMVPITTEYARTSGGGALERHLDYLTSNDRWVPTYRKGEEMPIRQKPIIPKEIPKTPKKDIKGISEVQSPSKVFERRFDLKDNPVIDAFESLMSYVKNVANMEKWTKNVLKDVPNDSRVIASAMKELAKEYEPLLERSNILSDRIKEAEAKRDVVAKNSTEYQDLQSILKSLREHREVLNAGLKVFYTKMEGRIKALAEQSSDARVYLSAANELPKGITLSPAEIKAATALRGYLDKMKSELKELSIPTLEGKSYMPRIWKELFKDTGVANIFSQRGVPTLLKFMSRGDAPFSWLPSAHASMRAYIPSAEYKVAYQPFLNRWRPFMKTLQHPELRSYMERWIQENLYRKVPSGMEKALNSAIAFEYTRLIGLSLSVGFKHLLKLNNTLAIYGPMTTGKAATVIHKVPIQALMERFGVKGPHNELRAFQTYVNLQQMVRALDEIPSLDRLRIGLKSIVGQPVVGIEMLDNGISVLSGILAAGKKGVDPAIAHRAIWETILDANFRSAWDQPLWQKQSGKRALTMFQMTPYKLAEMKMKMIEKAIHGEKDAFGTLYSTILTRYLIGVGVAEAITRSQDTSILEMFFHIPFLSETLHATDEFPFFEIGKVSFQESPIVGLAHELHVQGVTPSGLKETAKKHFSDWGQYTKTQRVREGDIPERYGDDPLKYLLGTPETGRGLRSHKQKTISIR